MLAWLLSKSNKVLTNTYRAKKLLSPFTIGVEKGSCMSKLLYFVSWRYFQRLGQMPFLFCKSIKNNFGYCGGNIQGPGVRNKRKRKSARNSIDSVEPVEPADATLGISEK
jgi:hypothetical protein